MNRTLTVTMLANMLAEKSSYKLDFCKLFISEVFKSIFEGLKESGNVKVKDLGNFVKGENGKVSFIPSPRIAELVNEPFSFFEPVELEDGIDENTFETESNATQTNLSATVAPSNIEPEVVTTSPTDLPTDEDEIQGRESEGISDVKEVEKEKPSKHVVDDTIVSESDDNLIVRKEENDSAEHNDIYDAEEPETAYSNVELRTFEQIADSFFGNAEQKKNETPEKPVENITVTEPERPEDPKNKPEPEESRDDEDNINLQKGFFRKHSTFLKGLIAGLLIGVLVGVIIMLFGNKPVEIEEENVAVLVEPVVSMPENYKDTLPKDTNPTVQIDNWDYYHPESGNTVSTRTYYKQPDVEPSYSKRSRKHKHHAVYDTITPSNFLTRMAKKHYNHREYWVYIYEENKNILGHPDTILLNTIVIVPSLSKYGIKNLDNPENIEKAKRKATEIYNRFLKKVK